MKLFNYLLSLLLLAPCALNAQLLHTPNNLEPDKKFDNVHVQKLYSDSLSTSFVIWVKKDVKAHRHAEHTECIYVLEGSGEMEIGEDHLSIVAGDYLIIPKNTVHSVVVSSREPLKIISIQSPEFDGKDRVWVD